MPGGATLVEFIGAGWLSIGACMRVVLMTAAVGPALEREGRTGEGGGRGEGGERKGGGRGGEIGRGKKGGWREGLPSIAA